MGGVESFPFEALAIWRGSLFCGFASVESKQRL